MLVISGVQIWPLSGDGSWTLERVGLHALVRVQLKGWEPKERAPTAEGMLTGCRDRALLHIAAKLSNASNMAR